MNPTTGTFFVDTPLSVIAKGRARNEHQVVSYVKSMLMAVGLKTGQFNLVINTRIHSGGDHHRGVEIKNFRLSGIRLAVQYGDNGTRFECFLSSAEFKPSNLYDLLTASSKVKACHYLIEEGHPTVVGTETTVSPESIPPAVITDKMSETIFLKPPFESLKGSSKNSDDVELILTAIKEKHGLGEFTQYDFHKIVVEKINANANKFVSGQLIRRLGERGHVKRISGKRWGEKKFQIPEEPVLVPAIQPTSEPGGAQTTVLEKRVVELKGQIRELETALMSLSACNSEIEKLERFLADARSRRESLLAQVGEKKVFINNIVSPRVP